MGDCVPEGVAVGTAVGEAAVKLKVYDPVPDGVSKISSPLVLRVIKLFEASKDKTNGLVAGTELAVRVNDTKVVSEVVE